MLAEASGQSFTEMLSWAPRDVDTLEHLFAERARIAEQRAEDERFERLQQERRG